jgi:hypothetical protein
MRATIYYIFDSFLRMFYKGYRLFLHLKYSAGALKQ